MSQYTTEVRFICESMAGLSESQGLSNVNEIIDNTAANIIGDYPIFDETYRNVLNNKIIKHYYTREIGYETVGLWKLKLNMKMNEIMPYYNKFYKSELLNFNPMYDVDYTMSTEKTGDTSKIDIQSDSENNAQSRNSSKDSEGSNILTQSQTDETTSTSSSELAVVDKETGTKSATGEDKTTNAETKNTTTKTENNTTTTTDSDESSTAGTARIDAYADTPQGGLDGLNSYDYLTNARKIDDSQSGSKHGTSNATADGTSSYSEDGNTVGTGKKDWTENDNTTLDKNSNTTGSDSGTSKSQHSNSETNRSSENERGQESITGSTSRNSTADSTIKSTEDYLTKVNGKRGTTSYSKMLQDYRHTFLNIDMMVIDDLKDLFMNIW